MKSSDKTKSILKDFQGGKVSNAFLQILEQTSGMERSEIEAIVSMLNLKRDNNELDKAVLEGILKNKNLSDESMKKTEAAIMAHYNSTANKNMEKIRETLSTIYNPPKKGGAKRKRRRKTKRKTKRKKRRKTKRKRRRKTKRNKRRKRRTRKMRGGG